MAQTYCVTADVEFVLSAAGVTACLDDDETGRRSAQADDWIDRAIEIAADKINQKVTRQYKLTDLSASNTWLRDTNAYLAAKALCMRRGNPAPESISGEVQERESMLEQIRWGRDRIPQQRPSADHTPAVSNLTVEPRKAYAPVRVVKPESTGNDPPDGVRRYTSGDPTRY